MRFVAAVASLWFYLLPVAQSIPLECQFTVSAAGRAVLVRWSIVDPQFGEGAHQGQATLEDGIFSDDSTFISRANGQPAFLLSWSGTSPDNVRGDRSLSVQSLLHPNSSLQKTLFKHSLRNTEPFSIESPTGLNPAEIAAFQALALKYGGRYSEALHLDILPETQDQLEHREGAYLPAWSQSPLRHSPDFESRPWELHRPQDLFKSADAEYRAWHQTFVGTRKRTVHVWTTDFEERGVPKQAIAIDVFDPGLEATSVFSWIGRPQDVR